MPPKHGGMNPAYQYYSERKMTATMGRDIYAFKTWRDESSRTKQKLKHRGRSLEIYQLRSNSSASIVSALKSC